MFLFGVWYQIMNIEQIIADELKIKKEQVKATIELIDEGCTIPFIARYRKEKTGALNDEVLRLLEQRLTYLRNLEDKKSTVLNTIEEQGKLTEELKKQIDEVLSMVELEDIYRPYKPKRRTRATIAKEKGLMIFEAMTIHHLPAFISMKEDLPKIGNLNNSNLVTAVVISSNNLILKVLSQE